MAFSEMSAKERTIITILVVVIVLTLVGIGILAARLVIGGPEGEPPPAISVATTTALLSQESVTADPGVTGQAATQAGDTLAPVSTPLEEASVALEGATKEPVAIVRAEGVGPLAPVIIADQALQDGHRYRFEVTTKDGPALAVQGNWSQAATGTGGRAAAPEIHFFEGTTPLRFDLRQPLEPATTWQLSVSAGPKTAGGESSVLVITVWDLGSGE